MNHSEWHQKLRSLGRYRSRYWAGSHLFGVFTFYAAALVGACASWLAGFGLAIVGPALLLSSKSISGTLHELRALAFWSLVAFIANATLLVLPLLGWAEERRSRRRSRLGSYWIGAATAVVPTAMFAGLAVRGRSDSMIAIGLLLAMYAIAGSAFATYYERVIRRI